MSISLLSREGHMTTRRSSSASPLRPVERSRLYEQLVEMLCEHIDDADLQPGDRLPPERELAAQVGVSRASISRRRWPRRFWASSTSSTARARSCSGPAPSSRSWRPCGRGNADCLRSSRRTRPSRSNSPSSRRDDAARRTWPASTTRWRTWRRGVGRRPGRGRRQALPTPRSRPRRAPACSRPLGRDLQHHPWVARRVALPARPPADSLHGHRQIADAIKTPSTRR
jgi:hypothetical protein